MAAGAKGRKGKLNKHKASIAAYYNSGRNLFNQARRIAKHLRRYSGDVAAANALKVARAGMSQAMERKFVKLYESAQEV